MFPHSRVNKEAVPMKLSSVKILLAGALLGAALSGCIVAPAPAYEGEAVYQAPPPVQYEAVGVAPSPGYFWIGGAWFWEGGRYGWHPGHWEAPRQLPLGAAPLAPCWQCLAHGAGALGAPLVTPA
jgi:YXWGXW repeat-containing protein